MSETSAVRPHLERRFETHRVVFWHDPDGEYAADLDSLELAGRRDGACRQRRVRDQEPAAARRARRRSSSSTVRVPCRRESATGCSIWSWPTGCSQRTAPRSSQQELGLTADGIGEVVQAHEKFFKRPSAFRASRHCSTPMMMPTSCAPRCARCCLVSASTACWRSPARC